MDMREINNNAIIKGLSQNHSNLMSSGASFCILSDNKIIYYLKHRVYKAV